MIIEFICNNHAVWIPQNVLLGTKFDMDNIADAIEKVKNNIDEIKEKIQ